MRKLFAGIGLVVTIGLTASAVLPTFKSFNASGTAATPAAVAIPADPNSQVRIVSIWWQSDSNSAAIQFSTGAQAYYQTQTNVATSSVTNQISATNGLVAGSIMCLQHAGTNYFATLSAYNQSTNITGPYGGTNIVLGSGGWAVAASAGDDIYQMSSLSTLPVGATTNAFNGEAVYVGNYGRPVLVKLTPALATNNLPIVSVHYDQVGQY